MNAELWDQLIRAVFKVPKRVEFKWHKGHSGANPHNKTADKLARASASGPLRPALTHMRVRRKRGQKVTERGSIRPEGQRLTVYIVTDVHLKKQRMNYYKVEVLSSRSPYRGSVDMFWSHHDLRAGHTYSVRLNSDPSQPRIEKVFREVPRKQV